MFLCCRGGALRGVTCNIKYIYRILRCTYRVYIGGRVELPELICRAGKSGQRRERSGVLKGNSNLINAALRPAVQTFRSAEGKLQLD